MSIFVIADLHLSLSGEKPMDIYGGEWVRHTERIKDAWEAEISQEDTVILPGDLSWALKLSEAMEDLNWISRLPGQKVLFKGNHDLWWTGIGKLNGLFENMHFVQNTCYEAEGYAICGTRGWVCPGDAEYTQHDQKIYQRELLRLEMSLSEARKKGARKIIGVLHFPPTNDRLGGSGFTELFEQYEVETVVYGHLHGPAAFYKGPYGMYGGVEYLLTSCDKLKCRPIKIR